MRTRPLPRRCSASTLAPLTRGVSPPITSTGFPPSVLTVSPRRRSSRVTALATRWRSSTASMVLGWCTSWSSGAPASGAKAASVGRNNVHCAGVFGPGPKLAARSRLATNSTDTGRPTADVTGPPRSADVAGERLCVERRVPIHAGAEAGRGGLHGHRIGLGSVAAPAQHACGSDRGDGGACAEQAGKDQGALELRHV